jgi:L-rhamnose mutarotase
MSKRYILVNEIKPEYLDAYVEAHVHMHEGPWKEQLQVLRRAGATECISYLYKNLSILIYECEDIDESFAALGRDPVRSAWEEFTQPMFANSPKFDGSAHVTGLSKIFDLNQQLDNKKLEQF